MMKPTDRERLDDWLYEYGLYCALRDDGGVEAAQDAGSGGDVPSPTPAPAEGQIRLWPAARLRGDPVYGLLTGHAYGRWTVVPFSPLAVPAVPGEYRLEGRTPVRVLQGWNRRVLAAVDVAPSWCADRLEDSEWFWLSAWLAALEDGGDIPTSLPVGPPLRHPEDPRHGYLMDEADRIDACLGKSLDAVETDPARRVADDAGTPRTWRTESGSPEVRVTADDSEIMLEGAGSPPVVLEGEGGVSVEWRENPLRFPGANGVSWEWLAMDGARFRLVADSSGGGHRS